MLHADTPLFVTHRDRLVHAVAASRLPTVYPARVRHRPDDSPVPGVASGSDSRMTVCVDAASNAGM
jgi:hypothetical protein